MNDTTQILDDLARASEMEETMNMALSDMCEEELKDAPLSDETKKKMMRILDTIHKDTMRHMSTVENLIERIKEGALDE